MENEANIIIEGIEIEIARIKLETVDKDGFVIPGMTFEKMVRNAGIVAGLKMAIAVIKKLDK